MPSLPEDKEELLEYEAFIKEVLARREGAGKGGQLKPVWQRFLETTGGTALITVLIGGIMGSIITGMIQISAKNREAQQARLMARYNQAQVSYKEYLDKELEIVNRAFDLIGSCISASDDLISVTHAEFDLENQANKENKNAIIEQQQGVVGKFNETDQKWRIEEHKIGLLMSYYHHNQTEVAAGWQHTQEEVGKYMDCAYSLYKIRLKGDDISPDQYQSCEKQQQELTKQLSELNKSLIAARKFLWEEEIDKNP